MFFPLSLSLYLTTDEAITDLVSDGIIYVSRTGQGVNKYALLPSLA